MAGQKNAVVEKTLELRSQALAANSNELSHLEVPVGKLNLLLGQAKDLTAQQASLTASKQEVSKRLTAVLREAQFLRTFLDAGIREHYGNRSEKLVEFGLRPFRSQPRIRVVGPDGKPVKRGSVTPEPPANE
jgi:hypothetical protein